MISQSGQFSDPRHELWTLLEGVCEDRLSEQQWQRLEHWIVSDATARRIYRDYIELHGELHWDTALAEQPTAAMPSLVAADGIPSPPQGGFRQSFSFKHLVLAVTILLFAGVGVWFINRDASNLDELPLANHDLPQPNAGSPKLSNDPETDNPPRELVPIPGKRVQDDSPWPAIAERPQRSKDGGLQSQNHVASNHNPGKQSLPREGHSVEVVVAAINAEIRQGWDDAEIHPSPIAGDAEWLRRVHLDLVGQIPAVETVETFLKDRRKNKRERMVNELLNDPAYVRHFATVWTNLLVGRSTERDVDRYALHRFMRENFARNRPWSEVVSDLVSAEGPAEENGASGFLLAHLNNQAVPATAITARLFLCTQVQCTQCHKHPHNEALQNQFWELNSFFKQTEIERHRVREPNGQMRMTRVLVSKREGGPTFYEDLNGVMQTAYPKFAGVEVSPKAQVNRREELAELMISGDSPQIAKAMVNRMWSHFFGYGFTRPVDDMGPHNAPSHPDLLERLSREFVRSSFDVKELIRWICLSDPYHRSSQFTASNELDNPSVGETPLFSRMYVRSMTAEQLYDSLLVASKAHFASGSSWQGIQLKRQEWLQQFVTAFETEENDEETLFEGTVPQALLLMNSELTEQAVRPKQGTYFAEVLHGPGNDVEKIRRLSLAALSRYPTSQELAAGRKLIQSRRKTSPNARASAEALQDIFWAFLNSNEFILVH